MAVARRLFNLIFGTDNAENVSETSRADEVAAPVTPANLAIRATVTRPGRESARLPVEPSAVAKVVEPVQDSIKSDEPVAKSTDSGVSCNETSADKGNDGAAEQEQTRILGGNYRIVKRLGEGGSAQVFLAEDMSLGRKVAVKLLLDVGPDDQELIRLFQNEGRVLAELKHPAIITVFSVEEDETLKFPFLVMEYFEGKPLDSRGQEFRENPAFLFRRLIEIVEAVHACHSHANCIVHRDIKPDNVLINERNEVKLIDFGISRAGGIDLLSGLAGTLEYMAPELYRGETTTPATDIYALGIMFWELIVGKTPFQPSPGAEDEFIDLQNQHCNAAVPVEQLADVAWAQSLSELLTAMLAKNPVDRPAAPEIIAALKRAILVNERRIGDQYEMESLLASEKDFEVYRARELKIARTATIKILSAAAMKDEEVAGAFVDCARKLGSFEHACLPKVFNIDRDPNTGNLFCVMSAPAGQPLRELLAQLVHQPRRLATILQQVAAGVEACCMNDFRHGRIDVNNIMVGDDDQVLLVDYFPVPAQAGGLSDLQGLLEIVHEISRMEVSSAENENSLVGILTDWTKTAVGNIENEAQVVSALIQRLQNWEKSLQPGDARQVEEYSPAMAREQKIEFIRRLSEGRQAGNLSRLVPVARRETDPDVLCACIQAIAATGGLSQAPLLAEFVRHAEPAVRRQAIKVLDSFENPTLCLSFFGALNDADPEVRSLAGHALKVLGLEILQEELQSLVLFGAPAQQEAAGKALRFFPEAENRHLIELLEKSPVAAVVAAAGVTRKVWARRQPGAAGRKDTAVAGMSSPVIDLAGHTIVCGYGSTGSLFVDNLLRNDKKVVVVDDNLTQRECGLLKEKNLKWVSGSALDPVVLMNAGLMTATSLIALTGDDDRNLEIGLKVQTLRQRAPVGSCATPLRSFLHLYHHHRRSLFYRYTEASSGDLDEMRTFSLAESASRQLIQRYSPPEKFLAGQLHGVPLDLLVVGFSPLAMVFCVQLAKHFQGSGPGLLNIVVVDSNVAEKAERFRFLFPTIDQVVSLRFEESRVGAGSGQEAGGQAADGFAAIYCFPETIEDGKVLLEQYSAITQCTINSRLLLVWPATGHSDRGVQETAGWNFYDYPVECCSGDLVMNETQDVFARALHSYYCEGAVRRGEAGNQNLVEWQALAGEIKDSNRSQADHILVKLRSVGCSIGKSDGESRLTQDETDILAKVEHRRWVVEKLLNGWKYGPTRDSVRQTHPNLIPWEALSEIERAKNRIAVMRIPDILALAGCGIVRQPAAEKKT